MDPTEVVVKDFLHHECMRGGPNHRASPVCTSFRHHLLVSDAIRLNEDSETCMSTRGRWSPAYNDPKVGQLKVASL